MTITEAAEPAPRVREWPLLGSGRAFQQDRLGLLARVVAKCGDVGQFHLGRQAIHVVNRADLVHEVLVARAGDFAQGAPLRRAFAPVLGEGLITADGAAWRRQRKMIASAFQPRQVAGYAGTMAAYAAEAPGGWPDGEAVDIAEEMRHLTMRVMGKVLFDAEGFDETHELGAAILRTTHWAEARLHRPFALPLAWPTRANREVRAALALIERRVLALIDERRMARTPRGDLLTLLLRAYDDDGSTLSEAQIRDEALTLFMAGYETTASALTWAGYLLAGHPPIYRRVQAEVDTALAGRVPGSADLERLPYTFQVLKETLRLYPPTYLIARTALHDVALDGYRVCQGQTVVVSPYTMHRRPDYYPEPERFDPERWTPEQEAERPRYAYLPFGAGSRACLGTHFAQTEMHLLLATLVQRVEFALVPGQAVTPWAGATLAPRDGCRLVVTHRPPVAATEERDEPETDFVVARSA